LGRLGDDLGGLLAMGGAAIWDLDDLECDEKTSTKRQYLAWLEYSTVRDLVVDDEVDDSGDRFDLSTLAPDTPLSVFNLPVLVLDLSLVAVSLMVQLIAHAGGHKAELETGVGKVVQYVAILRIAQVLREEEFGDGDLGKKLRNSIGSAQLSNAILPQLRSLILLARASCAPLTTDFLGDQLFSLDGLDVLKSFNITIEKIVAHKPTVVWLSKCVHQADMFSRVKKNLNAKISKRDFSNLSQIHDAHHDAQHLITLPSSFIELFTLTHRRAAAEENYSGRKKGEVALCLVTGAVLMGGRKVEGSGGENGDVGGERAKRALWKTQAMKCAKLPQSATSTTKQTHSIRFAHSLPPCFIKNASRFALRRMYVPRASQLQRSGDLLSC